MQGARPRTGSSEMQQKNSPPTTNPKRSPSPKITRSSSVSSSDSIDSRVSRVVERKPSSMSQSVQEKQRNARLSEMQQQLGHALEDLRRANEDKSLALEELTELKKLIEKSKENDDRIMELEVGAEKAKEAESRMLESLVSQTKQLEQTMILLEEAKLEIKTLRDVPVTSEKRGLLASVQTIQAHDEIRNLRAELRFAIDAEEKSKKAMDDLAIALKEVTTEATLSKEQLAIQKSEAEKAKADSELNNSLLQNTNQKLQEVVDRYTKLKLEYEESAIAWKTKQDSFINCMKITEEDMDKKDEEIGRLLEAHKTATEENSKLRDIIKQAVNEAMVVKESLEIVRKEKYELDEKLSETEKTLQKIRQEYETLKSNEAAAIESVKHMKNLLALASDSKQDASLLEVESKTQPETTDDRKISRNARKFSSDRYTNRNPQILNGSRHSIEVSDKFEQTPFGSNDKRSNSIGFLDLDRIIVHDMDNDKQKKKKTVFGRFGDALRRRSFRKT